MCRVLLRIRKVTRHSVRGRQHSSSCIGRACVITASASCGKSAASNSSTAINGFIMFSSFRLSAIVVAAIVCALTSVANTLSEDEQAKIDQLFVFSEKQNELSPSDVSAVQFLLAAGASVANGMGASRLVHCNTRWQ